MKIRALLTAAFATGALLSFTTSAVYALPITDLYNTGVDNSGVALGNDVADTHYEITSGPVTGSGRTISSIPGSWVSNNAASRWIGPVGTGNGTATPGDYVYETTFTLPQLVNLASVLVEGDWGADNTRIRIILNGNTVVPNPPTDGTDFDSLAGFSISDSFVVGLNTLEFVINNTDHGGNAANPTGLRVDNISGSFELVPEPGALGLLATGIVGLGLAARRRRAI